MEELNLDQNYFKRNPNEYERNILPFKEYIKQASMYVHKRNGISLEEARALVLGKIKVNNTINPTVRYHSRKSNGDIIETTLKMTDYLKDVVENDELVAPSLTSYVHPSKIQSVHGEFLMYNVKERSRYKKEAFKAKQEGNKTTASFYDTLQKTKKVFNNSLSGAYASKSTVLYNPSSHSTLTSITRCVASIGNSISESIVAGNKHFRKPDLVYNYITAIISNVDKKHIEIALAKFNIYVPTIEDVMEMIIKSIKYYWRDEQIENDLRSYLSKLDGLELAAVLYVNDMYHFRKHNPELMRSILTELKEAKQGLTQRVEYLTQSAEGVEILAKIINGEFIKGLTVDYKNIDPNILDKLASTAMNICNTLSKYKPIFRQFLTTSILPISIAYIKDMMRECIVLSDTDSTCGSYGEWIEWYYGGYRFDQDAISLSAAIMTINTQAMDHNIKVFAKNMNVQPDKTELLKMKNEFFWSVFTPSNVSKHYYANTCIQEGNVYKNPELELKGAHFIASVVNQTVVKQVHEMITEVNLKLSKGEKLELFSYVSRIADLERYIIEQIKKGDISMFGKNSIKDAKSYKQDPKDSPYWNHLLWEKVFEEKYGSPGKPPYMFIKIPTILSSNKKLKEFLDTIEDVDIRQKLTNELALAGKVAFRVFRPPLTICASKGIPEEFHKVIDYHRVVEDNLKSGYLFLETLGFFKKQGKMIKEMGY